MVNCWLLKMTVLCAVIYGKSRTEPDIPGYIVNQAYYNLDSKRVITCTGKLDNIFSCV